MDMTDLLREIRTFIATTGMRPSTLGRRAVNDGKFVTRLERGGQVTVRTVGRVRQYMAQHLLNPQTQSGSGRGRIRNTPTTRESA